MTRLGRVLLIDGSAVFRELFASVLEPHAEAVTIAADCEAAVAALETAPHPDLLVCDLRLPDGDGFEVMEHARELPGGGPAAVLTTGDWSQRAAARARATGAVALLAKPLSLRDLALAWSRHAAGTWKEVRRTHAQPIGVAFVLDPADEDRSLFCWPIVNLGANDALLDAGGPVPVGIPLALRVHVGDHVCRADTEVVRIQDPCWDRSAGVAVRFKAPTDALRALIADTA